MDSAYYTSRRKATRIASNSIFPSVTRFVVGTIWPLFIPTFMRSSARPATRHETDWTYGLRGIAALIVVHAQLAQSLSSRPEAGWGLTDEHGTHRGLMRFPILRSLHAGSFAVALAFIICAYRLSLSITRSKSDQSLVVAIRRLASSVLRQHIRLCSAAIASTVLPFVCIRGNLFAYASNVFRHSVVLNGRGDSFAGIPNRFPTVAAQILDLTAHNLNMFYAPSGSSSASQSYNSALWVLPILLQALTSLYVIHLLLLFMRRESRSPALILFMGSSLLLRIPFGHLFVFGVFLAESGRVHSRKSRSMPAMLIFAGLLLVGLFLGSIPSDNTKSTPFYHFLGRYNPLWLASPSECWQHVGAMLTMLSITQVALLRRYLSSTLGAYFGRVSMSLYLCHFPVLTLHGTVIFDTFLTPTGWESGLSTFAAFTAAYVCTMLLVVYLADRFEELIDRKAVALAVSLENLLMEPS